MPELITIEEADEIIAQHDDFLFCLRSLKNISPLLKQITAEIATFIHDKQDRYIFTEITSGTKMQDVAKRCDISYDRLCYRYKNIVLRLQESTGFLAEYKKTIKYQDLEIERLRLENRNMEYELKSLYKKALESGLDQLKFQLEKHKILNKAGQSELYQYIINDPDY